MSGATRTANMGMSTSIIGTVVITNVGSWNGLIKAHRLKGLTLLELTCFEIWGQEFWEDSGQDLNTHLKPLL